jgi:beta-glucosidase
LDVFEFLTGFKSQYGLYNVHFDKESLPIQARLEFITMT